MKLAVSWLVLVLALGLQIHSAFLLGQQLAKPAHYHHQPAGALDQTTPNGLPHWLSSVVSDIGDGHKHPHPEREAAPATTQHSQIAHHAHDPGASGVVYVGGQGDEPDQGSSLLRSSADPFLGLLRAALELPPGQATVTLTRGVESGRPSHASAPPEKPPRA